MAGFASQAALRSHYEDLIDETEQDIQVKLSSAVSWFKQVLWRSKFCTRLALSYDTHQLAPFSVVDTCCSRLENVAH